MSPFLTITLTLPPLSIVNYFFVFHHIKVHDDSCFITIIHYGGCEKALIGNHLCNTWYYLRRKAWRSYSFNCHSNHQHALDRGYCQVGTKGARRWYNSMWDKFKFKVGDLESLEIQFVDGFNSPILNECILDDSHIYFFNFYYFWCCILVGSIHD